MLFEVDEKGRGKAFNPTDEPTFDIIHTKAWETAQGVSRVHPDQNRIEEITEADVPVVQMELQMAQKTKRGIGDIRKGDYIDLNAGDESSDEDVDAGAYGRVLEPIDKDHFLFLILGVNQNARIPFISALVYETDGRIPKRRVQFPSELEPGKIYAVDCYGQIPEHAEYIRHLRATERGPGWIHVPDEALDLKGPGARRPRR